MRICSVKDEGSGERSDTDVFRECPASAPIKVCRSVAVLASYADYHTLAVLDQLNLQQDALICHRP